MSDIFCKDLAELNNLPLDECIKGITSPTSFVLKQKKLTKIPQSISKWKSLEKFNVSCNDLTSIPDTIMKCMNLKLMNCSFNQISKLPEKLPNITHLQCRRNILDKLPLELDSLIMLDCSYNQLGGGPDEWAIPDHICKIQSLRHLHCQHNFYLAFPEISLGHLDTFVACLRNAYDVHKVPTWVGEIPTMCYGGRINLIYRSYYQKKK